jgi:hypothetical protein
MPTSLYRVQALFQPDVEAKLRTLAKLHRRSHSSMVAILVEEAMKLPEFRECLTQAVDDNALCVPKEDNRTYIPRQQYRDYSFTD